MLEPVRDKLCEQLKQTRAKQEVQQDGHHRTQKGNAKSGVRAAGCVTFFWPVGGDVTWWCSRNLVLSLKLPSSTWVRALVPAEELKDIVMYIPWGGTRILPQGCTIVSWLLPPSFCIPSLPWLATVWICPLEFREGQRGWIKPISYKQEMGDTRDFLGGPVVKTLRFRCRGHGFDPWFGN